MRSSTKSFPSFSVATDPVTGAPFTTQYDIFSVGAGYLDITAALNDIWSSIRLVPRHPHTAVFDTTTNTVRVVNTDHDPWQGCHLGKRGDLGERGHLGLEHIRRWPGRDMGKLSALGECGHLGYRRRTRQRCDLGQYCDLGLERDARWRETDPTDLRRKILEERR